MTSLMEMQEKIKQINETNLNLQEIEKSIAVIDGALEAGRKITVKVAGTITIEIDHNVPADTKLLGQIRSYFESQEKAHNNKLKTLIK